jgi:hypothetical protein
MWGLAIQSNADSTACLVHNDWLEVDFGTARMGAFFFIDARLSEEDICHLLLAPTTAQPPQGRLHKSYDQWVAIVLPLHEGRSDAQENCLSRLPPSLFPRVFCGSVQSISVGESTIVGFVTSKPSCADICSSLAVPHRPRGK